MNSISAKDIQKNQTDLITNLISEVEKVFVGKRFVVELTITSLLAKGHLLIEDIPGVGKTTLAKALSKALDLDFSRIQFTSDMLPSDILGTFFFQSIHSRILFSFRPHFQQYNFGRRDKPYISQDAKRAFGSYE